MNTISDNLYPYPLFNAVKRYCLNYKGLYPISYNGFKENWQKIGKVLLLNAKSLYVRLSTLKTINK